MRKQPSNDLGAPDTNCHQTLHTAVFGGVWCYIGKHSGFLGSPASRKQPEHLHIRAQTAAAAMRLTAHSPRRRSIEDKSRAYIALDPRQASKRSHTGMEIQMQRFYFLLFCFCPTFLPHDSPWYIFHNLLVPSTASPLE